MTRPSCAGSTIDPHCERNVMRWRDGLGYCLWHPTEEPPVIDPKTGRPVAVKPTKAAARPKHLQPSPAPDDDLAELQAELDELEATDPAVAAAAASYDATVDRILTRDPETPTEGKANDHATEQGEVSRQAAAPQAHDGADSHDVGPVTCEAEPAPEKGGQGEQPTLAALPPPDPYQLGMRITAEHCQRLATDPTVEHAVRCIAQLAVGALTALIAHTPPAVTDNTPPSPRPACDHMRGRRAQPIDEADAVRRYQDGAGLFDLAAELHIGAARLRAILTAHQVPIRGRGQVIGRRGPEPRPLDVDQAVAHYQQGLDSAQVARQLGVKQQRVADALRERGVLKRRANHTTPLDEARARELYATGQNLAQVSRALGVRTNRVADLLRAHGELRPKGRQRVHA